jgi:transposase
MAEATLWVGLDLGERVTSVCVIDDAGAPLHEQDCPTSVDDIEASLSAFRRSDVGLIAVEAGSETHLVRKLRARGYPVGIFESRKASRFLAIRRCKTDSGDARGLADIARLGRATVSQVYLKSPECQQLRSKLIMRRKLVHLRVAMEGSIRSRLALHGRRFSWPHSPGSLKRQVIEAADSLKREEGWDLSDLLPLADVCESLRAYLHHIDRELNFAAKANPICKLLMEIPGVGPLCALTFYSSIEDPERFRKSADVAAYLGLIPRRYQSGEHSRTLGITKTGCKLTRTLLVTAATIFRRHAPDCALKAWALALQERIGPGRSRVALARKLAIVMLTMWKRGSHFQTSPLSPTRSGSGNNTLEQGRPDSDLEPDQKSACVMEPA